MSSVLPIFGVKLPEMTGSYRARNWKTLTILRTLDLIGRLLPKRQKALPQNRKLRILVTNWGHLGDVVTLLPMLKFLQDNEATESLGVLTGSWASGVLKVTDLKTQHHVLDHWALDRGKKSKVAKVFSYFRHAISLVRELRRNQYDISIETFSTPPVTNALTWLAGIPCRIGFDSAGLGTLLTHPVKWLPTDLRVMEQQLRLLDELPVLKRPLFLPTFYPGFVPTQMPDTFEELPKEYVVFHMGAGESNRGWPTEKWVELATTLRARGLNIIFSGAPGAEAVLAERISAQTRCRSAAGLLSWQQFVTLIAQAKGVVCVDTVTSHIAACFSIPTTVLTAGRQRTAYWRPNNDRAVTLSYPVGCSPCYQTNGCASMACINFIETDQVLSTFLHLLDNPPTY